MTVLATPPHSSPKRGKRTVGKEQYFTEATLAKRCIELVDHQLGLQNYSVIVEPSAGGGSFLCLLPIDRRIGVDIDPKLPEIIGADFLKWQPPVAKGSTLVIGNPPFGQRAAMAIDFIEHAASFADAFAFILPRSFNKYTFQNRINRQFHLVDSFECEEFELEGSGAYSVKTVFQIWVKKEEVRQVIELPGSHPHFDMKHCHLSRAKPGELDFLRKNFPFTIPQVGSNFKPREAVTVDRGSHWFIRPLVPGVREVFEELDFGFLRNMNTAHTSLSKRDIVAAYAAAIENAAAATDVEIDVRNPRPLVREVLEDQLSLWPA